MWTRHLMLSSAACAISMASHPMFAAETGSGSGGKASEKPDPKTKGADTTTGAETQSAVSQANAAIGEPGEDALKEAPTIVGVDPAEHAALQARLADAEEARLKAESEAAAARAEADTHRQAADDARDAMRRGGSLRQRRSDGKVEVRVKTPLLIQPDADAWRYVEDGPPPNAVQLQAGLNFVEPWVADHWLVRGSLEDDFAADQAEAAAEEPAAES